MVDNLVVQITAVKRMGVADEGGERSVGCTLIQHRFKPTSGTGEREGPNGAAGGIFIWRDDRKAGTGRGGYRISCQLDRGQCGGHTTHHFTLSDVLETRVLQRAGRDLARLQLAVPLNRQNGCRINGGPDA